ncbi:MAG: D-amino acid dehydrogenase [Rhodocyclaceae bacterium]|nr:D-amino acid dehydrogenase [Rhodocyclaceae bacterium]
MHILILGAGLIGVASAWHLAREGLKVTVLDRQPGVARETSFANGGQISTSHAEPWANPRAPQKILAWLGRSDAPLLWRWRLDPAQWRWGLRFLGECRATRTRENIRAILALALMSREKLKALRQELSLDYDCLECGILHVYTDRGEFAHAVLQAETMRRFGCDRRPVSADECLAIEPALAESRLPIVGGTYTADDESGDAHRFAVGLAEHCRRLGVRFRFGETVCALEVREKRFHALQLASGERISADCLVVAAGSFSTPLLAPLGLRLPVYPAKGYSVTIPLEAEASQWAPRVSLIDDGAKLVFSRLGARLRVAGTAEFAGYDLSIRDARIAPLLRRVRALFPRVPIEEDKIERWCGLRPATPGNVPLIGPTPIEGLYLNTGHGTLGWTMAVGSGALLADLILGRAPEIDPSPYRMKEA